MSHPVIHSGEVGGSIPDTIISHTIDHFGKTHATTSQSPTTITVMSTPPHLVASLSRWHTSLVPCQRPYHAPCSYHATYHLSYYLLYHASSSGVSMCHTPTNIYSLKSYEFHNFLIRHPFDCIQALLKRYWLVVRHGDLYINIEEMIFYWVRIHLDLIMSYLLKK